jgi:hypothetical protein
MIRFGSKINEMTIRVTKLILFTPSEALAKLEGFNSKVDRLISNQYKLPRLRTQDLNSLIKTKGKIRMILSVAVHAKNQERAKSIITECEKNYSILNKMKEFI